MSDFYLTLPSNSLPKTNTTAQFSIYLPNKIDLSGKWEVALVEIQYPFSWNNLSGKLLANDLTDNFIAVTFTDGHTVSLSIPPGYYSTADQILAAIDYAKNDKSLKLKQQAIEIAQTLTPEDIKKAKAERNYSILDLHELQELFRQQSRDLVNGFVTSYNHTINRVKVKRNPKLVDEIILSQRLEYMLGLEEAIVIEQELVGKFMPDLKGGFYALHIYCNLVEPQIIGNTTAPLLRLVNVEGSHGSMVEKTFHSPHYVPVVCKEIDRIDIEIKDDNNELVPFDFGKTVLKLHFRKRRSVL